MTIKDTRENQNVRLDVHNDIAVADVIKLLQKRGWEVDGTCELIYNGSRLERRKELGYYSLQKESILYLSRPGGGGGGGGSSGSGGGGGSGGTCSGNGGGGGAR